MNPLPKVAMGMAVALVALGIVESGLRLAGVPDPGIYAGDLSSVWTLRPNLPERSIPFGEGAFTVRTNDRGLRGPPAREGGIVVLGCSTTFGWGVEEEESWPAALGAHTDLPVINGGVPGYTSAQGLATVNTTVGLRPQVVILSYLVRDAQKAPRPDDVSNVRAMPVDGGLALFRLLRHTVQTPGPDAGGPADRVPPEAFADNIRAMDTRLRLMGAWVLHIAFPMRDEPTAHLAAWRRVAPELLVPTLPDSAWSFDGIHLTAEGNRQLAAAVASHLPKLTPQAPRPVIPEAPVIDVVPPGLPSPSGI